MVRDLGGGRLDQNSVIQPEVGVDQLCGHGSAVRVGEVLGRVHAMTEESAATAFGRLSEAITGCRAYTHPDEEEPAGCSAKCLVC